MRPIRHLILAVTLHLLITIGGRGAVAAELRLAPVIGDNAVLQRELPAPIWGEATPGAAVTVSFAGQTHTTTALADGRWRVDLDPLPASTEGRALTVSCGEQTLSRANILVGEVWLCSGQSNMDKPVGAKGNQKPTTNFREEIAAADLPQIRLLVVRRTKRPATRPEGQWRVCTPASLEESGFSAVGYFFARQVHREVNVPVGMIQASVGGTRIEAWTPPKGFGLVPSLRAWADAAATDAEHEGVIPSSLYRAMVAPLAPYAMRGALWYQGEANCWLYEGPTYTDKMRALIGGWRDAWGGRPFPFYFVQLAPYRYSARPKLKSPADALPRIRDAQTRALAIPNTAMVVTTDLVDDVDDIHPVRKREVGERLAACALARDYGQVERPYRGPTYQQLKSDAGKLVVKFAHADGGLKSRDDKTLSHFAVAGDDGQFVPADATIGGSDSVTVSSSRVAAPKFVRFAWSETATPNLCNGAGLPAVPFRTDDFSTATSRPVGGAAAAAPE